MSIWPTVSPFELLVYFTILVSVGHGRASSMAQPPLSLPGETHKVCMAGDTSLGGSINSRLCSPTTAGTFAGIGPPIKLSRSSLRRALPHILGLLYGVLMDPNYQNFHDSTYCLSIWQVREFRRFVVGEEVP